MVRARHTGCNRRPAMATEEAREDLVTAAEFREQEAEFYKAVVQLLSEMAFGATVADALSSPAGQRIRTKWMLKYGRQPPL